jgi:hypothetical protein
VVGDMKAIVAFLAGLLVSWLICLGRRSYRRREIAKGLGLTKGGRK